MKTLPLKHSILISVFWLIPLFFFLFQTDTIANSPDTATVVFNDPQLELVVRFELGIPSRDITDVDMLNLVELFASSREISDLTGLEYALKLQNLILGNNNISDLTPLKDLPTVNWIVLDNNEISDLSPLANLSQILYLRMDNNQVTDISPLKDITDLAYAFFSSNQITDLSPIENKTSLRQIDFNYNQISNLSPLANLVDLTYITFYGNSIDDISSLQNLTKLEYVDLGLNNIADISALSNASELLNLDLGQNKIQSIDAIQNLDKLERLALGNNMIVDISPIQNKTDLEILVLNSNQIKDISGIQGLSNLRELILRDNKISDISSVRGLNNLEALILGSNKIKDIADLTSLTKLSYLDLDYNPLNSISGIQNLPELRELYLSGCSLSDISPLSSVTSITYLSMRNNFLDNEDLTYLWNLDNMLSLDLWDNRGIISGTTVQELADQLDDLDCNNIYWEGTCGIDLNQSIICWVSPSDTTYVGQTVTMEATSTDTNQLDMQMIVDWGDGNISNYSDYKSNGLTFEFQHIYAGGGTFDIRVNARNSQQIATGWTFPWTIHVDQSTGIDEVLNKPIAQYTVWPNPFIDHIVVGFELKRPGEIMIDILDPFGRSVQVVEHAYLKNGQYEVKLEGVQVNPGIYFFQLQFDNYIAVRKVIKMATN